MLGLNTANSLRVRSLSAALALAGLLACALLPGGASVASDERPRTVLILVPGQPTGTQTNIDAFAAGARRALLESLPVGSSVYLEYTDLARPGADQTRLRDWYRSKYAGQAIDLVLAGGQEARTFVIRFRSELWPEVPILVAAAAERNLQAGSLPAGVVAQTIRYDEEGTIRLALSLVPGTQHIVLVAGSSNLDRYLHNLWVVAAAEVGGSVQVIDLSGLALEELKARLGALPPRTIVFFSSLFSDGTRRAFVNPEILPVLAAASNSPIFSIHAAYLGLGVVGGAMTDYGMLGAHAGGIGARMAMGQPLPPSPIRATEVNRLLFDWRELERWGIDERRLPAGSIVMHRPPSPWQLYRWPIVIGLSLLLAQTGLIAALLVSRARRRRAERQVEEGQALQHAMLSSLPSRIAVLDRDGRMLAVNRAWLDQAGEGDSGLWRRARVGQSYLDICREAVAIGEDGAASVLAAVEAGLEGGEDVAEVEYAEKDDAAECWFRLSVIPLGGGHGVVLARTEVTDQVLAREQLRQFSGHLLAAQEDERRRIARELHDDLNQRLVLLALEISQLDPATVQSDDEDGSTGALYQLAERVGEIATDVHRLAYRLHPFKLEYLGLVAAARGLCEEVDAAHQISIGFFAEEVPGTLPPEAAVCAYRVLQEALSNVVKHSASPRAEVRLATEDGALRVSVRDFGMGMAPEIAATSRGLGLSSMRERLRAVDGRLILESAVAAGTELTVLIPLALPSSHS
jgi:signal transduction histidine kinase